MIAEVSSSKSRVHAANPLWLFSATIVSSASDSGWGRFSREVVEMVTAEVETRIGQHGRDVVVVGARPLESR